MIKQIPNKVKDIAEESINTKLDLSRGEHSASNHWVV